MPQMFLRDFPLGTFVMGHFTVRELTLVKDQVRFCD